MYVLSLSFQASLTDMGPWEMLWCSLQQSPSIDGQLKEGSVLLLLIYRAVAECCLQAQSGLCH